MNNYYPVISGITDRQTICQLINQKKDFDYFQNQDTKLIKNIIEAEKQFF